MKEENPYQTPEAVIEGEATLLEEWRGVYVDGDRLILEKDYWGPKVCMQSGVYLPDTEMKKKSFYHYPPVTAVALALLIGSLLLGILPLGVIAALVFLLLVRRRFTLDVVIAPNVVLRRRMFIAFSLLMMVAFVATVLSSFRYAGSGEAALAFVFLIAAITLGLLSRSKVKVVAMDEYRCTLKGVHPKFINYLRTGRIL